MDASAKRSYEVQAQIRQNQQELQATVKELYSWEREMKDKERRDLAMASSVANDLKAIPVRSQMLENSTDNKQLQLQKQRREESRITRKDTKATTEHAKKSETITTATDSKRQQQRKEANDLKEAGNRNVKFQQYELAIEKYTAANKLCPDEAIYYTNRALCYLKLERYEQCIKDCDQAIALDKNAVKAYYRRMQANECLGNYVEALRDCQAALNIEPKNAEAKQSLDRINNLLRKTLSGPSFSPDNENFIEIKPMDLPPNKRSRKFLRRLRVEDVVGAKEAKTFKNVEISDEDIDKLFNSNCGPFEEVKKSPSLPTPTQISAPTTDKEKIENFANTPSTSKAAASALNNELDKTTASTVTLTASEEETKSSLIVDSNKLSTIKEQKLVEAKNLEQLLINRERPLPSSPTSSAQFYTHWKELPDEQKYQYLKSIDLKFLSKILGAGFDSDTLTDCFRVLRNFYLPNKEPSTAETLLEMSRNDQITILSLLMSSEDHKALSDIMDWLKKQKSVKKETLDALERNFNLF